MIVLRKIAQPVETEIIRNGTIVADTLSGTLDNSNQVYYTTYTYRRDRIDLHYNGQALHAPEDFSQGPAGNQIIFKYIEPYPNDVLRATYELDASGLEPSVRNRTPIPFGATQYTILFASPFVDTNYNINSDLITTDSDPSVYSYVIANKTVSGFTIFFSGEIDSNNYVLEWLALR
jgi:hypothetical protein